ncbi:MAG: chemotaxis protein CheB [Chloroflexi bacterium]|nr:chemotaxis protein CheB [Chloroflexota bacterium]
MPGHDIVVVGASAGGVEALRAVVRWLPADLPAAVFVVLHLPSTASSYLPEILHRAGPLPAVPARDGEPIEPGRIYVAPPDYHLVLAPGVMRVRRGPRENNHRPAIDPLFRSAARSYGPRTVGVVLSGNLYDGTLGLMAVKQAGGITIIQDPADALFGDMPKSALDRVDVDYCLPAAEIGRALGALASEPAARREPARVRGDGWMAENVYERDASIEQEVAYGATDERPGQPAVYSCPDCHGTLWEVRNGRLAQYECRVGHTYSEESLLIAQTEALESALWAAFRALEEKASLARRLTARARERGLAASVAAFEEQERAALEQAELVRRALDGATPSRSA